MKGEGFHRKNRGCGWGLEGRRGYGKGVVGYRWRQRPEARRFIFKEGLSAN